MEWITDPTERRLDDFRHLTDRAARRSIESPGGVEHPHGLLVVEGAVAVDQLLRSDLTPARALLNRTGADRFAGRLAARGAEVLVGDADLLESVAGYDVHRGILVSAARPAPQEARRVLERARRVLVVEAVTDNENVGGLFRNAAAFGFDAVVLDRRCADPFYRRSIRVSSGWTLRIPHARVDDARDALDVIHALGIGSVALAPGATTALSDAERAGVLSAPIAALVGAEGSGLDEQTLAAARHHVCIPMSGDVDSLNVATAFAVLASRVEPG